MFAQAVSDLDHATTLPRTIWYNYGPELNEQESRERDVERELKQRSDERKWREDSQDEAVCIIRHAYNEAMSVRDVSVAEANNEITCVNIESVSRLSNPVRKLPLAIRQYRAAWRVLRGINSSESHLSRGDLEEVHRQIGEKLAEMAEEDTEVAVPTCAAHSSYDGGTPDDDAVADEVIEEALAAT